MTCCSSGKARVYYNIPISGGLKYKLKNSTKWVLISANEQLTDKCVDFSGTTLNWECPNSSITAGEIFPEPVQITGLQGGGSVIAWMIYLEGLSSKTPYAVRTFCDRGGSPPRNIRFTENVKYKFTVTGTETGTKYLEIEVDECPAVQTIPCKFDPAKEQYFDVELSTSPNVESCIDIWEADPNPVTGGLGVHILVIKIVRDHKGGPRPPIWSSRGYFYSPKGCPPPKVRVECCTTPDCQNNKKCPKGTTCEIVCGGFKCCYSKDVLIRSIKL